MKNILIIGIARTGKTTLSEMIKKKYPNYSLIHSDSIKWAIIRADGKENYYRTHIKEQNKFENSEYFQKLLLEFWTSCLRNDKNSFGYILESGQLYPKIVRELVNFENTKVICLGHGNLSEKQILDLCKKYDTEKDWTYNITNEELKIYAENWNQMNEQFKEECFRYGIQYIDTSKDRKLVLKNIVDQIERN